VRVSSRPEALADGRILPFLTPNRQCVRMFRLLPLEAVHQPPASALRHAPERAQSNEHGLIRMLLRLPGRPEASPQGVDRLELRASVHVVHGSLLRSRLAFIIVCALRSTARVRADRGSGVSLTPFGGRRYREPLTRLLVPTPDRPRVRITKEEVRPPRSRPNGRLSFTGRGRRLVAPSLSPIAATREKKAGPAYGAE
jgi:hypothetical protein